jgi:type IV pilus biogenesis protein CpaD/CtpE
MMKTFTIKLGAALAVSAALSGCAQTSPQFESGFGHAVRAAVAAQTVNPEAVRNTDAVSGIDARAAVAAQQRYENSYRSPVAHEPAMTTGLEK